MIRCLTSTLLKQHQTLAHKICEGSNSDEADEIHTGNFTLPMIGESNSFIQFILGERRFECKECFRAYKEGYKLKAHYDTMHKDSKYREDFKQEWGSALTCPICKKQFETAFIHQSHLQTHSGLLIFVKMFQIDFDRTSLISQRFEVIQLEVFHSR